MNERDDPSTALAFVRTAIPGVGVDDEGFRAHVEAVGPTPEYMADLCIAYAAMRGDPKACRELELEHRGTVILAMSRAGLSGAELSDATQALWTKLLTTNESGAPPRLARYAGRGPLGAWIKICASREAVDARRRRKAFEPLTDLTAELVSASSDLEKALAVSESEPIVRATLQEVLRGLPSKFQNLLRHRFIDRLSSEELATLYGVHRATIDRWLTRARWGVLQGTRRALQDRLALRPDSARSLIDAIVGDLDMSFSALAANDPTPKET
jgi:RNA polymerase sigma-70 factor (ECF subfamily)